MKKKNMKNTRKKPNRSDIYGPLVVKDRSRRGHVMMVSEVLRTKRVSLC